MTHNCNSLVINQALKGLGRNKAKFQQCDTGYRYTLERYKQGDTL